MPRLLVNRITDDCIEQFLDAARLRNEEARCLAATGHRAGAVYLWGYVAEMVLKSAWFRLVGKLPHEVIVFNDLRAAVTMADTKYGLGWQKNFHHIYNWAQLLTLHRITLGKPYSDIAYASHVVNCAAVIYDRWREGLRYKRNRPYLHESNAVASSAQWLVDQQEQL